MFTIPYVIIFVSCQKNSKTNLDLEHCEFDLVTNIQIPSYGFVGLLEPGANAEASPPLANVQVIECLTQNTNYTDTNGRYIVDVPDIEWIELEVSYPNTLPSRWIYNPRFEGASFDPYVNTLVPPSIMDSLGVSFDSNKAILVIDSILATENGVSHDLHEANIELQNEYMAQITEEGEDLVFLNVTPGPLLVTIRAPLAYRCLPSPKVTIRAGEVINLSLYCLYAE